VARVRHVRVDTTVSTVSSATLLGGLVDLDVLDDEVGCIQAFDIGIGFGILEQSDEELSRLDGPAGLRDTELLALRAASSTSSIPPHGNGLLMLCDVLEILNGALKLPSVDGLGGLAGVFEGDTKV